LNEKGGWDDIGTGMLHICKEMNPNTEVAEEFIKVVACDE